MNRTGQLLKVPVVLMGPGRVGMQFVERIVAFREFHRERFNLELKFVGLADRFHSFWAESKLSDQQLLSLIRVRPYRSGLDFLESLHGISRSQLIQRSLEVGAIVVDCTASDRTTGELASVMEGGGRVALANKRPLTGRLEDFRALTRDPRRCRWETTVASALPVIACLNRFSSAGDRVRSIHGTMSGTLGYLMAALEEGQAFSKSVKEAHRKGLTEPDPRDDLSAKDLVRKAVILARVAGFDVGMEDVKVTPIVRTSDHSLEVEEFLLGLSSEDVRFRDWVLACRSKDKRLRFTARISRDGCEVGPVEVPSESPLGSAKGLDNVVEIRSELFQSPLVLQGRGAGVEATAAGLLSDVVELALTG